MTIILDASVAVKLLVAEAGSEQARQVLERDEDRIAPDWIMAEVANALTKKVRFEKLPIGAAQAGLAALPLFIDRFVPTNLLLARAMNLAAQLDHSLYDCLYLVVALDEDGCVVTADDGLIRSARQGGHGHRVEQLKWTA